jgi:hypothetical protein
MTKLFDVPESAVEDCSTVTDLSCAEQKVEVSPFNLTKFQCNNVSGITIF